MRRLRALLPAVGTGVLIGIVLTMLRLQVEFAWAWALLGAAIVLLLGLHLPDDPRADSPRVRVQSDYVGSDVSRLAWAINLRTDTVNEAVTRRLRATLRRRLLWQGIDVDDARCASEVERLLGEGLWARVNGRRTTIADVREALAAAERLAPPGMAPPETASRNADDSSQRESRA